MSKKSIRVPVLTRVEGEGALEIDIDKGKIQKLDFRIFEPPRFFEKFLEGRPYSDVMDIVARICGICPVAYQMSAAHALESIFGIQTTSWTREMRRLFYCGEWIQSHSLHVHMLALPDFLGVDSVIEMAKTRAPIVKRGIMLQHIGDEIVRFLGGRAVHPVGACVGGFYSAPTAEAARSLLESCEKAIPEAAETVRFIAKLPLPAFEQDITFVSLHHPKEYPFNEGRLVSNKGLDISIDEFDQYFKEEQNEKSNALYCSLNNQSYLVGPLSRLNLNYKQLPDEVLDLIEEIGLKLPSRSVFDSVLARAIEIYYAFIEAKRILSRYSVPKQAAVEPISVKAGIGFGCTEAPRGICWHRYEIDSNGSVKSVRIVPPTSQNQNQIEADLRFSLEAFGLDQTEDELRKMAEMVIRNYDPCISCSVHFLKLKVNRL